MFTGDLMAKMNLKDKKNLKNKIGVVNTNVWKIMTRKFMLIVTSKTLTN